MYVITRCSDPHPPLETMNGGPRVSKAVLFAYPSVDRTQETLFSQLFLHAQHKVSYYIFNILNSEMVRIMILYRAYHYKPNMTLVNY